MSRVQSYQSSFTVGELDPLLRGRIDLQQYYNGVSEATNVIFEPQGGFSRRPGLRFVADITDDNASNGHMLIPFEFSTSANFMVVASATITNMPNAKIRFRIFKNQQLITNINGTGDDYLEYGVGTLYQVSDFDINDLYYTQSADTLICVHPYFRPFSLVRGATDSDWTATSLAGSLTIPRHAFTIVTTRPATTITPSKVDGTVTLTAGSSIFQSSDVDQFVEVDDGFGRLRITQFISGTEVKGITEVPFFDTSAIASNTYIIERGYEDAWSDSRGWTKTATFHEGRLYFGGSASLPSTLFGSKVNDFFNFKASEGLDDDAIKIILNEGVKLLLVKTGAKGVIAYYNDGRVIKVPGFKVKVTNVLGAGDAFAGGFIYGYINGWDDYKSLRLANACGAWLVTKQGCCNFAPYYNEIIDFINEKGGF